jgi:hypothetical protein
MSTWSPTSLFNRRGYGSENLSALPQKDFCNTIRHERTQRYGILTKDDWIGSHPMFAVCSKGRFLPIIQF